MPVPKLQFSNFLFSTNFLFSIFLPYITMPTLDGYKDLMSNLDHIPSRDAFQNNGQLMTLLLNMHSSSLRC